MEYKIIEEFPNYGITKDGNVINIKNKYIKHTYLNDDGYVVIKLYRNNKYKVRSIHRLMAIAFLDNPNNLLEVNHKDGNKLNNSLENLEWCSHSYNIKHAWDNHLIINTKERSDKIKQKNKDIHNFGNSERAKRVQCIETGKVFDSISRAEYEYGLAKGSISNVCRNKKQKTTFSKKLNICTTWRYYE